MDPNCPIFTTTSQCFAAGMEIHAVHRSEMSFNIRDLGLVNHVEKPKLKPSVSYQGGFTRADTSSDDCMLAHGIWADAAGVKRMAACKGADWLSEVCRVPDARSFIPGY